MLSCSLKSGIQKDDYNTQKEEGNTGKKTSSLVEQSYIRV